jgi:hypothetical protein
LVRATTPTSFTEEPIINMLKSIAPKLMLAVMAVAAVADLAIAGTNHAQAGVYVPYCYYDYVWSPYGYVYRWFCY